MLRQVQVIADFQFGNGAGIALFPDGCEFILSRTGRIRQGTLGGKRLATVRAQDGRSYAWNRRGIAAHRSVAATCIPGGAGRSFTSATFFQAKHAFKSVDDGAWGVGVVAGLLRFPRREARNDWGDPYLIVPVSFGLGEDKDTRALLHLNVGAARLRDEARNVTLWGVAVEKPVTARLTLLGEAFGENAADPFLRAGGRYTLFDKFDVDLTWVTRAGGAREERFWSLGFHWETDPLQP